MAKGRCQRIGCDALFAPDDNEDETACCYHPGPPLFHDGGKQWSCCKQRSHDFSLFLSIPGCTRGKHTSEKPQTKAAPSPNKIIAAPGADDPAKLNCLRCKQGFFCSDHGTKLPGAPVASKVESQKMETVSTKEPPEILATAPKVIDMDAKQTCKNKCCGKTFTERENHETACSYHPGQAVFHDRSKGWSCCNVHVKEFEEFLEIPTCAKGWHSGQ